MRMWSRANVFNVLLGVAIDCMGWPQIRSGVDSAGRFSPVCGRLLRCLQLPIMTAKVSLIGPMDYGFPIVS